MDNKQAIYYLSIMLKRGIIERFAKPEDKKKFIEALMIAVDSLQSLTVTRKDIKEALIDVLEREPTEEEYKNFFGYLITDVQQWLNDNKKAWIYQITFDKEHKEEE